MERACSPTLLTKKQRESIRLLDDIEAAMPAAHREIVKQVYGEDWPRPFTSVFTQDANASSP